MLPYIHIGKISISVYWTMFFVGAAMILVLTLKRRKKYNLGIAGSVLFTLLTVILGLGGAKLLYIFENWEETLEKGVSLAGVSFFGSVWLIPLLMMPLGLLFKLKPKRSLDAVAPAVAVMIGCIRVGCFFNGCCGGWTTSSRFTWPTQAMESVCDFMLLYLLLQMEKKERFSGWLYPTFLGCYSTYRFFIEFLRTNEKVLGVLTLGHIYAFAGVVIGGVWLIILRKKTNNKSTS